MSLYIAAADYRPDRDVPTREDHPELQQGLVRYIVEEQGLDRTYFSNIDQLARAVLKEDWPKEASVKPYASLGSRFKGCDAFLRRLRESLTRADGGTTAIVSRAL